jgi:hypothetical protein
MSKNKIAIFLLTAAVLFSSQIAASQSLDDIDRILADATNISALVSVSIDITQSEIGVEIKRPLLELLMQREYGSSYAQYGEDKTIVRPSDFWETALSILTFQTVDKVWQEDYFKSLRLNGIFDVANQNIPIKLDMKNSIFANYTIRIPNPFLIPPFISIDKNHENLMDITSNVTGKLVPKIENGEFVFEIIDLEQSNVNVSGKVKTLIDLILLPLTFGPTPGLSLAGFYGFAHWTDLFDGLVADGLEEKSGEEITVDELNRVRTWANQFFQTLFNAEGDLLTLEDPVLDEDGLWIYFSYDPAYLEDIYNQLLDAANALGIIDDINEFLWLQSIVNLGGFDLTQINENHDRLIVGLSGAGVYPQVLTNREPMLRTYTGTPVEPIPLYGDGTYPLPANYAGDGTVAVVGTPWLSSVSGSLSQPDQFWGPDPLDFAERIDEALGKMAPDSKLILLGKSLGGCKMEKIVDELNTLGVPVDLLIVVDGSCLPADQSGVQNQVPPNVKRVYNFRQTMAPPENDNQNGFQILWSAPTIGEDVIVNDEALSDPMCIGVGHDDIDECEELLAEIDRLIRGIFVNRDADGLAKMQITSRYEGTHDDVIVRPRIVIKNTGTIPVEDFKLYYYFTTQEGKTPVVDDYYTPFSNISLESVGVNNYRITYDFYGTTLNPGSIIPNSSGNVVGIHYPDWSQIDKSLHSAYSSDQSFAERWGMDIKLAEGTRIFGGIPAVITDPVSDEPDTTILTGSQNVVVPPGGIKVLVKNPSYRNGLMFSVRNKGLNDYITVQWYGVLDQNFSNCQDRSVNLSGNGAQINNICTPKNSNDEMTFILKSQNNYTYSAFVDLFEWFNGPGCN